MNIKKFYSKNWKKLMIIPIIFFFLSCLILYNNYQETGEYINKDVSLKGGYLITIKTDSQISDEYNSRELVAVGSGKRLGYTVEYGGNEIDNFITKLSSELNSNQYSIEELSPSIANRFWEGTIKAISIAILAMSGVMLLYFRRFVPAFGIIISGISNIVNTLAVLTLLGINLSSSGIAALLMLLGYSIDSNIVLTSRVLKNKHQKLDDRIFSAFETGMTMTLTSIVALTILYLTSSAEILKVISVTLIVGLLFDMVNTWIQNAGILRYSLK